MLGILMVAILGIDTIDTLYWGTSKAVPGTEHLCLGLM